MESTLYTGATLKNLIDSLGPVKKAERTPTSRKLREEAGEPIITTDSIVIYPCGYAVYENESGRTVMWVPGCTRFTYYFDRLTNTEQMYQDPSSSTSHRIGRFVATTDRWPTSTAARWWLWRSPRRVNTAISPTRRQRQSCRCGGRRRIRTPGAAQNRTWLSASKA